MIASKLNVIAENMPKVYNAGYEKGKSEGGTDNYYDAFWDNAQDYGNRKHYYYAFGCLFNENNFYPKYTLENLADVGYMFRYMQFRGDLAQRLDDLGIKFSFVTNNPSQVFRDMPYVTRLFTIDCTKATTVSSLNYWFMGDSSLQTIDKIILNNKNNKMPDFVETFGGCVALQNITFEGVIGNNIDFASCTKLSKDSIENVIGCLSENTTGKTATFSQTAVNNAFGSSESDEWLSLKASKKNWNISLI
jgi:hypothetical protein